MTNTAPSRIKVMTDYDCPPLWNGDRVGPIVPRSLDLPESLILSLEAWQKWYDETLVRDDPAISGFSSEGEKDLFVATGELLATRLAMVLGDSTEVVYFDANTAETRPIPSQDR